MVAAGLLAKKAVEKGLKVPPHVKTSLAPGSRVVTDYFDKAGLDEVSRRRRLLHRRLRLHDLHRQQRPAARADLAGRSRGTTSWSSGVLSGNRNFEGRINPDVKANYLASPPLVVAYALAGTTDIDFDKRADRRGQERRAGLPARHLADARRSAGGRRPVRAARDVREAVRRRLGQEPEVERDQDERRRALRMGPGEHVHPGAAVPGRPHAGSRARSSRSAAPAAWRRSATR